MVGALLDVVRVLVVVGAWALAHHALLHLGELTNLGGHGAAEAVGVQTLEWEGERTKHESVQWRVCGSLRETMNESAQL